MDPARASRLPLLAKILIGYGVVGLIGAVIAALLLVLAFGRVTTLSTQLTSQVGGVSAVLDKTATALDDAASSARASPRPSTQRPTRPQRHGRPPPDRSAPSGSRDGGQRGDDPRRATARPAGNAVRGDRRLADRHRGPARHDRDEPCRQPVGARAERDVAVRPRDGGPGPVRDPRRRPAQRGDRQPALADPRPARHRRDRGRGPGRRCAARRLVAARLARDTCAAAAGSRFALLAATAARAPLSGGRGGGPSARREGPTIPWTPPPGGVDDEQR